MTHRKKLLLASVITATLLSSAEASGRRPTKDEGFPDYNRLELHPKMPEIVPDKPPAPPPPPKENPFIHTSTNSLPSDVDAAPKPPPKPVFLPDGGSEPSMPDDMLDTLVPGTTNQK